MLASDGTICLRVITGMKHGPATIGVQWPGDDLLAGLATVNVLYGRPYAEQIWAVDVTNYSGRKDAHAAELVLLTEQGTEVRWGLPPGDKDYFVEIPIAQKLSRLESAWRQYGRVDAGQPWIDIRFDRPTIPAKTLAASTDAPAKPAVRRSPSRSTRP